MHGAPIKTIHTGVWGLQWHEDVKRSDRGPVTPRILDFGVRPKKAATVTFPSLYVYEKSPLQERRIREPESRSKANGDPAENRTMVIH